MSRSICDFAELTKFFDQYNVSFCSVTQDINTSTSSGRMMLNILMTFAQYEREIIGERIRDKFAASKRKGMWMGGAVPLGYRVQDRKLVVVDEEAETVRHIYRRYLDLQSPKRIAVELNAKGLKTKTGRPWNKGNLHHILRNCVYIGKVSHKGETFDGEQPAIVDLDTWETVQRFMNATPTNTDLTRKSDYVSALKGLLYCGYADKSELANLVFSVIYQEKTYKYLFLKRCQIVSYQLKKVYPLLPEGNFKLVKLSTYANAELVVTYKPKPGLRILEEKFYFSDYLVKNVKANGVRIAVKEVASLKLRSVKEVVHANTAEPTLFDDENQEE